MSSLHFNFRHLQNEQQETIILFRRAKVQSFDETLPTGSSFISKQNESSKIVIVIVDVLIVSRVLILIKTIKKKMSTSEHREKEASMWMAWSHSAHCAMALTPYSRKVSCSSFLFASHY